MADKASLQMIGLVLASVTACTIFVASMLVYSWADGRLADHQMTGQLAPIVAANRT